MTQAMTSAGQQSSPAGASSRYGWYVLAVLTLVNVTSATDRFLMGVIMVPLKADLRLSDTSLGLLQGLAFALLYCAAAIPLGRLVDSRSRRTLLATACAAWTFATGACAFVDTFASLFAMRVIVGLGEAAIIPASISLIGAYIARDRLGTATSIFLMGATTGKAVAFIVGGALLSVLTAAGGLVLLGFEFRPWQALFLAAAVPGIPVALMLLTIREPARHGTRPSARAAFHDLLGYLGRHRLTVISFIAAGTCAILNAQLFAAWTPSFFVRRHGLGVGEAAMLVGVIVVAVGPLGGIAGGMISDRMLRSGISSAPLRVMCGAFLLAIPGTVLMVTSDSLALALAGYGLTQAAVLAAVAQAYSGIQMLIPLRYRGTMSAIFQTVTTLTALGLGPTSIGLFSDHVWTDPATGLGYSIVTVLVIFTALGLLALGITARRFVSVTDQAHQTNLANPALGSELIDQSQKMTVAASAIAERNVVGDRS